MPLISTLASASARGYGMFGGAPVVPNSYESIQTVTVGSGGAANVEFTTIPSTYKHLQVRWIARASSNGFNDSTLFIRFNSDTTTVCHNHFLIGDGSSASTGNQSNTGNINIGQTVTVAVTANIFAAGVIDILDYQNTNKNKTVRHLLGFDYNGAGKAGMFSGSWGSTVAIDTIRLASGSSQFEQYSQFALYGIKG